MNAGTELKVNFSQMTNFRFFQTHRICRKQLYESGGRFFKRIENIVGIGDIAPYKQFLLFLQCFQKKCTADT